MLSFKERLIFLKLKIKNYKLQKQMILVPLMFPEVKRQLLKKYDTRVTFTYSEDNNVKKKQYKGCIINCRLRRIIRSELIV